MESRGNANVLSTPNLMTLDNEEASITVGQTVPFVTGSYTTTGDGASNPFQTVSREDVGLTLRIRPGSLSDSGTVTIGDIPLSYTDVGLMGGTTRCQATGDVRFEAEIVDVSPAL